VLYLALTGPMAASGSKVSPMVGGWAVAAAQVIAEWQNGVRQRVAGERITVELERLGEKLVIAPQWGEVDDEAERAEASLHDGDEGGADGDAAPHRQRRRSKPRGGADDCVDSLLAELEAGLRADGVEDDDEELERRLKAKLESDSQNDRIDDPRFDKRPALNGMDRRPGRSEIPPYSWESPQPKGSLRMNRFASGAPDVNYQLADELRKQKQERDFAVSISDNPADVNYYDAFSEDRIKNAFNIWDVGED
jgi:hypothetical protein